MIKYNKSKTSYQMTTDKGDSELKTTPFLITFQEDMNIPNWSIHSFKFPNIYSNNTYSDLIIYFYDPIAPQIKQLLFNNILTKTDFNIKIQILGPCQDIVEEWDFEIEYINYINPGEFGTGNDINKIEMSLKVKKAKLNY
jgi:hypothetical protein